MPPLTTDHFGISSLYLVRRRKSGLPFIQFVTERSPALVWATQSTKWPRSRFGASRGLRLPLARALPQCHPPSDHHPPGHACMRLEAFASSGQTVHPVVETDETRAVRWLVLTATLLMQQQQHGHHKKGRNCVRSLSRRKGRSRSPGFGAGVRRSCSCASQHSCVNSEHARTHMVNTMCVCACDRGRGVGVGMTAAWSAEVLTWFSMPPVAGTNNDWSGAKYSEYLWEVSPTIRISASAL